jgi:hypothetical protein
MAEESAILYRDRAEDIRKLAEAADHPSLRAAYMAIAQAWVEMAEQASEHLTLSRISN